MRPLLCAQAWWKTQHARPIGSQIRTSTPAASARGSSPLVSPSITVEPVVRACVKTAPRSDAPCPPAAGIIQWGFATVVTRNPGSSSRKSRGSQKRERLWTPASTKTGTDIIFVPLSPAYMLPAVFSGIWASATRLSVAGWTSLFCFFMLSSLSVPWCLHFTLWRIPVRVKLEYQEGKRWNNSREMIWNWVLYVLACNWVQVYVHVSLLILSDL